MPCFQEKPLSKRKHKSEPQTDTGGQVDNNKALESTRVTELGKMVPQLPPKPPCHAAAVPRRWR
ncbi:hypothetical protein AWZ99_24840 [Shigella sonnei]|nr:hypothetical protein AWZ99_24840 [Shigella sonnei]